MLHGLRVMRGPDWTHADEDGGEFHVGTVVEVFTNSSVKVQWDMGLSSVCKAGQGQHELLVLDSAPVGISHPNVVCVGCNDACISGPLWKCTACNNVTLCSLCYHDDKHDTGHDFVRIDFAGCEPVNVPQRRRSQRSRALGIYPNSTIERGPDWEYENQDGGVGKHGIVEDIVNFGQDVTDRNAVRVRWPSNSTHIYRVGYKGKVDLKCLEEAPGPSFYPEHVAFLDVQTLLGWNTSVNVFSVGDKVCVAISSVALRELQQGRCKWSTQMAEIIGEIGIIKLFTQEGDVEVEYGGETVTLNKAAITKVPICRKGDKVKVIGTAETMKRLQRKHGGWDDEMEQMIGKIGLVAVTDNDGDVAVIFQAGSESAEHGFVFHPSCLMPVEKAIEESCNAGDDENNDESSTESVSGINVNDTTDTNDATQEDVGSGTTEDEISKEDNDDKNEEDSDNIFVQALAGLLLLEALSSAQQSGEPNEETKFLKAIIDGKEADVKEMLKANSSLIHLKTNGTPTICIAAYQGHLGVVKAILEASPDEVNSEDAKGNTAAMIAILTGHVELAKFLLEHGGDRDHHNLSGTTLLHCAANKNMLEILTMLLQHRCNVNAQDEAGNTPLHEAISERHDQAAACLIEDPDLNVWLPNNKFFNVMQFACFRGHGSAVDKLLSKEPKLANMTRSDGFTPLHIAAANNHVNEANILIIKGKVDVNSRSLQKMTPLHIAVSEAYFDMVKLLLTYDADFTLKDCDGNTPLHICMKGKNLNEVFLQALGLQNFNKDSERLKIADFLIQHGASIDITNNAGETPLTVCSKEHLREAVKSFAANNKPTKPERGQKRPITAKVEHDIYTAAKQRCHKCSAENATIRFLPCRHQISCVKCCFLFKHCPICSKEISKRVDNSEELITDAHEIRVQSAVMSGLEKDIHGN